MSAPSSAFVHVGEDLDAEAVGIGGQQRAGRDQPDARAHLGEQIDVRARDAAVQDVAADRHDQPFEARRAGGGW